MPRHTHQYTIADDEAVSTRPDVQYTSEMDITKMLAELRQEREQVKKRS